MTYAQIIEHLVEAWGVAHRSLSGKAARAQDYLCQQAEKYQRLADEIAEALAKTAARPLHLGPRVRGLSPRHPPPVSDIGLDRMSRMNVLDVRVFVRAWRHGPGQSVGIGVPRISCPSPTGSGNVQDEGGRRPVVMRRTSGSTPLSSPTSIERPWASIGRGSEVPAREEKRPMRTVRVQLVTVVALAAIAWSLPARAANITIIGHVSGYGYQFTNFDGPTPNAAGTTINGISNNGTVVGFSTPDGATLNNFTANPLTSTSATLLNINGSPVAMANGINTAGTVVGSDGNNNAFTLSGRTMSTPTSRIPACRPPRSGSTTMA